VKLHKNYYYFFIIFFFGIIFIFVFILETIDHNCYSIGLRHEIVHYIKGRLVFEKRISSDKAANSIDETTILYTLGGNQGSLRRRYLIASELYHSGLSKKIMILSRPGITEFDSILGRNLTNDEWSIRELRSLNVQQKDIELVSVNIGYLGTFREAMRVMDINRERGGGRIILVTSSYHTRRVFLAFSAFQMDLPGEIYVYGSVDSPKMITIISETVKLFLYENFLLPAWSTFRVKSS